MEWELVIITKHLYEGVSFRCSSALCLFFNPETKLYALMIANGHQQ